jgi:hypothetical protein
MSDTPRTDAVAQSEVGRDIHYRWQAYERLARQLEKEVAALQCEIAHTRRVAGMPPKGGQGPY